MNDTNTKGLAGLASVGILGIITIIGLGLIIISTPTLAQPPIPNWFYGEVLVNGAPATGLLIEIKNADGETIAATAALNGHYGIEPDVFYVDDTGGLAGETITFFVDDIQAEQSLFSNGAVTELNLAITKTIPPQPQPPTNGGGGSSRGGGAGPQPPAPVPVPVPETEQKTTPVTTQSCISQWECSDWFPPTCDDGKQNRVCVDKNQCDPVINKPSEQRDCSVSEPEPEVQEGVGFFDFLAGLFGFTGFAATDSPGLALPTLFGLGILIILILGGLIYWKSRK